MVAATSPVLGAPASIMGLELPGYWAPALRFAPSRSLIAPRPTSFLCTRHVVTLLAYIRNIIPDGVGIPDQGRLGLLGRG